ncbi:hypothetical protein AB0K15_17240 [Amycolatopsis sp. NPDC049253]
MRGQRPRWSWPEWPLPDFVLRGCALVNAGVREVVPDLGRKNVHTSA